uniref:Reelin domain-containing protein n=1 Tax=Graphocephala atropunctata TaxID=36148 RepID=A0A1B6LGF1_9HEMI
MILSVLGIIILTQQCRSYYEAQYAQIAPLQATRDLCVNMIPPYVGRKPVRNRYPMNLEVDSRWISHKRLSISAYTSPNKYMTFSGMMVQIMKKNLPFGEFESDLRVEITDCSPGSKNLACLRSANKLREATVNWVSPPGFDVYTKQLQCVVTIIALNQRYWTITLDVEAAPYVYPVYGNFTSDMGHPPLESPNLE